MVLTLGDTRKEGHFFFVNFDDYKVSTQGRFFDLYRSVGLEASLAFLGEHFPPDFEEKARQVSEVHIKAAERNLSEFVQRLAEEKENQPVLMEETTSVLRNLSGQLQLNRIEREAVQNLHNQSNLVYYKNVVEELRNRLSPGQSFSEVSGQNSWQKWIYRNSWLFGPLYLEPIDRQRVGFREIPDFLFPTLDGFIDILEIKLPSKDVITGAGRRPNAYMWSHDTNQAIGQVVNYIQKIDLHQLELAKDINRAYPNRLGRSITVLRPRAFVLIGTEAGWGDVHREAHRSLNYSLHGIEVITYDELLRRGKRIIEFYSEEPDASARTN